MVKFGKLFYFLHPNLTPNTIWYTSVYPKMAIILMIMVVMFLLFYYYLLTKNTVRFSGSGKFYGFTIICSSLVGITAWLTAGLSKGLSLIQFDVILFGLINIVYAIVITIALSFIFKLKSTNARYTPRFGKGE